jgi:hypothetical protein
MHAEILVGKPLGRLEMGSEDNTKIYLREVGSED